MSKPTDGCRWLRLAPPNPSGSVVLVHGYGEHIDRFAPFAERLSEHGFQVTGRDLRGHGFSSARRGYIDAFSDYVVDVEEALAESRFKPILIGQSMGALVALHVALRQPERVAGLVLFSPFLRLRLMVPKWKVALASGLSAWWPGFSLPAGLRGEDMTRDPKAAAIYDRDPLNNKRATARWFTETRAAQASMWASAAQVTQPCLVIHGEADPVADPQASVEFFANLGSRDKTLRMIPHMRHEPLHELEPDRVRTIDDVVAWVEQHRSK